MKGENPWDSCCHLWWKGRPGNFTEVTKFHSVRPPQLPIRDYLFRRTKNPYQGRVSSGCWWIYLGKTMETSGYFGESWVMCSDDLLLYLAVFERGSEASFSPHNLGFGPTTPCRQDCQVFSVQPGMLCVISSVVPWRLRSETTKSDLVWKYEK